MVSGSGPGRREDYKYYLIIDKETKMSCAAEELFEFFRLQKKGDITSTLSTKMKSSHKIIPKLIYRKECVFSYKKHTKILFLCSSVSSVTAPPGACAASEPPPSGKRGHAASMILSFRTIEMSEGFFPFLNVSLVRAEQKLIPKPMNFYVSRVIVELFTLPS